MVARIHREISLYELVGNIDTIHYLFVCMCVHVCGCAMVRTKKESTV